MREIALDTETTGLRPDSGDKIVEIGCVEMIDRITTGRHYHIYINPERDMPEEAYRIHGISTEFLQDKPIFKHVADDFLEFIGEDPLVIHNAGFDMKFLNHELKLIGYKKIEKNPIVDTLKIARKKYPGSSVSLDMLCKRFSIDASSRTKHGALLDSELLASVYLELMGGAQSSMDFSTSGKAKKVAKKVEKVALEKRDFPVFEEEKKAHQQFLESIDEPIWNS